MKTFLKAVIGLSMLAGMAAGARAQNPTALCVDKDLTSANSAGSPVLLTSQPSNRPYLMGVQATYETTGGPSGVSVKVTAGMVPVASATPLTVLNSVTTTTSGIEIDLGKSSRVFHYWYVSLDTLTGGTSPHVLVHACFPPSGGQ